MDKIILILSRPFFLLLIQVMKSSRLGLVHLSMIVGLQEYVEMMWLEKLKQHIVKVGKESQILHNLKMVQILDLRCIQEKHYT